MTELHFRNTEECINRIKSIKEMYAKDTPSEVALSDAINALEKQIAKKPILQITDEKSLYKCPCCDSIFVEAYDNMQRGYIPKFCEMCGQSISFRLE